MKKNEYHDYFQMQHMRDTGGALGVTLGAVTAVTAAAATYYIATRPEPLIPPTDINDQATILEVNTRAHSSYNIFFCKNIDYKYLSAFFKLIVLASLLIKQKKLHAHSYGWAEWTS